MVGVGRDRFRMQEVRYGQQRKDRGQDGQYASGIPPSMGTDKPLQADYRSRLLWTYVRGATSNA